MRLKSNYLKQAGICVFVLFFVLIQSSCISKNISQDFSKALVVDYKQFGPSQLSSSLLGQNYWQWQTRKEHSPTRYDIKVIIYRNMTLSEVKKRYPVDAELKQDYRYLEYPLVKTWIEQQIVKNQEELKASAQDESLDLILYGFSRLENMYKLLVTVEQGLRN